MRHLLVSLPILLSLGMDTFAVSAGLGMSRHLEHRARVRTAIAFAVAEATMPLIGFLAARPLGHRLGLVGPVLAASLLLALGTYMVVEALRGEESVPRTDSWALLALAAISVSLDELAIGFALGLLPISIIPAVTFIFVQAFGITLFGLWAGGKIARRWTKVAEIGGGIVLALAGLVVIAEAAGARL